MMPKAVTPGCELIMHVTIKLSDGSAADSTRVNDKPARLRLGDGSLSPAFEQQLLGMQPGEEKCFELAPEDSFGQPNPDNLVHMDRTRFSTEAPPEVGAIIAFSGPDGQEMPGVVREVAGESVTVDFNHPLAGQRLTFEVEILSVAA